MANYSNLAATINAQIKANGNQEITGPVLNAVLTAMVTVLGDGYRLKGVAAPADNPGSPDNRVAYLASQDGTYTNFGGLAVSGEIALLLWDASWSKVSVVQIDAAPAEGSANLVTSGGVDAALKSIVAGLAEQAGHYPDLFAGFAGNLVDTRSAGTRQGPFAFRQSGGDGVNYMRKILGGTEAWNQLVRTLNPASEVYGITRTAVSAYTLRYYGTSTNTTAFTGVAGFNVIAGHKYLVLATGIPASCSIRFMTEGVAGASSLIVDATLSGTQNIGIVIPSGTTVDANITFACFDLTLEGLGLTTADQFRALHPLGYYSPNAGELKNNAATGLETTGFNQMVSVPINLVAGSFPAFDKSIYTRVFGGVQYYFRHDALDVANWRHGYKAYDLEGNEITANLFAIAPQGSPYYGGGRWIDAGNSTNTAFPITFTQDCYVYFGFGVGAVTAQTEIKNACINRFDASRNGIYEPYWKREIVLGLDNLACHDEQDNAVVVNGLDGVGTAQDELIVENGWGTKINKRRKRVNLGDLTWTKSTSGGHDFFFSGVVSEIKQTSSGVANLICQRYTTSNAQAADLFSKDKQIGESTGRLYVYDTALSGGDAAAFKAAMNGVYADVELATPKVLTLDNPIPALIEVDNLGTEKRLPEDTADNPQAPFECDSNYSVSTANLVRLLNL